MTGKWIDSSIICFITHLPIKMSQVTSFSFMNLHISSMKFERCSALLASFGFIKYEMYLNRVLITFILAHLAMDCRRWLFDFTKCSI